MCGTPAAENRGHLLLWSKHLPPPALRSPGRQHVALVPASIHDLITASVAESHQSSLTAADVVDMGIARRDALCVECRVQHAERRIRLLLARGLVSSASLEPALGGILVLEPVR